MKSILLLDRSLSVNGTSVYYKNLSAVLTNKAKLYFFPFKQHVYYDEIASNTTIIKIIPFILQCYDIDIIYVCTAEMYIMALFFKTYFAKEAKIVYSIFHPRGNVFEDHYFGRIYKNVIYKKLLKFPESFVFYNELTKLSHQDHYGLPLDNSSIFPVLVKSLEPSENSRLIKNVAITKIISLGRLVDFKYHHEQVINAINLLKREKDIPIEYHIYGDGHLRNRLEKFVETTGSAHFVFIHGTLQTEALYEHLMTADLCIGMGTSLIYAASLSVPSILAIESSDLTYGFFTDDLKGYETGEDVGDLGKETYLSVFSRFFELSDVERAILKKKTIAKAQQYAFEENVDKLLNLLVEPRQKDITGISLFTFLKVLLAKVGVKLLPKTIGDK